MPFCSSCGSEYAAGARFCSQCGAALIAGPAGSASGAPQRRALKPVKSRRFTPSEPEYDYVEPCIRAKVPDFVLRLIRPSEDILASFSASLFDHRREGEFRHDKFVLTNERIIYYHTSLFHKGMGEMPYRGITGVSYNKGFRHGKVVVEAANAGLTMDGIGNDDAQFAEQIIGGAIAGRQFKAVE